MTSPKVGRPPEIPFTDELGAEICDRLADGESLTAICQSPGMPERKQIWRWIQSNAEFAANPARARRHDQTGLRVFIAQDDFKAAK